MAYTLCQYYPNMKITVCELQSVMDSAHHFRPSSEDCPNQGNVSYVVSDFFQPDLPKADLYVLCRILHDWTEDKVDLILSNVYKCLPSGKEVVRSLGLPSTSPRKNYQNSITTQKHIKNKSITEPHPDWSGVGASTTFTQEDLRAGTYLFKVNRLLRQP